LRNKVGDVGIQ